MMRVILDHSVLLMCLLLQFGSYVAIASQQKLERAPVHNLDADQSAAWLYKFKAEAVNYNFINTS